MPSNLPYVGHVREVMHHYSDALDEIWLWVASELGFRIVRSSEVYASTDGRGLLAIGDAGTLDADDSLGQMIFHELCHFLVEGPEARHREDWGLDNRTDRDVPREHACLRLQAALSSPHGLRRFFAPTTDFRSYYDALPEDPLSPADDPAARLARLGWVRASRAPWSDPLERALWATSEIARVASRFAKSGSLWGQAEPPTPKHPVGLPLRGSETCETCSWKHSVGKRVRCRQAGVRIDPFHPACDRWEPALDCQECGACCREAYHSVTISRREPIVKRRPDLVVIRESYVEIRRDGERCAALIGNDRFACSAYDDRPRSCRDFERGGPHCLEARRRVGLSR